MQDKHLHKQVLIHDVILRISWYVLETDLDTYGLCVMLVLLLQVCLLQATEICISGEEMWDFHLLDEPILSLDHSRLQEQLQQVTLLPIPMHPMIGSLPEMIISGEPQTAYQIPL
jgi:hypothetical protein